MSTTKIYDLAVKTGEYTNGQGETKGRYQNVGAIMQKDDGGKFIMLERWFSPAGVPNPENRSNVLLSMFPPKDASGVGQAQQQQRAPASPRASGAAATGKPAAGFDDMDDDIPF